MVEELWHAQLERAKPRMHVSAARPGTCMRARSMRVYAGRCCSRRCHEHVYNMHDTRVCEILSLDRYAAHMFGTANELFVAPYFVHAPKRVLRCCGMNGCIMHHIATDTNFQDARACNAGSLPGARASAGLMPAQARGMRAQDVMALAKGIVLRSLVGAVASDVATRARAVVLYARLCFASAPWALRGCRTARADPPRRHRHPVPARQAQVRRVRADALERASLGRLRGGRRA